MLTQAVGQKIILLFNRVSTAYLRLKSIELGHTFPKLKQIPNASLRVYANAYNLLTFTGVEVR